MLDGRWTGYRSALVSLKMEPTPYSHLLMIGGTQNALAQITPLLGRSASCDKLRYLNISPQHTWLFGQPTVAGWTAAAVDTLAASAVCCETLGLSFRERQHLSEL